MILYIIIGFYLLAGIILGLNWAKLRPGFIWFFALIIAISAWVLFWGVNYVDLETITLLNWTQVSFLSSSPSLVVDKFSWAYGLAIISLLCAVMIIDVFQGTGITPEIWSVGFALAASGLVAVFAGNPITLLLGWAIIDVAETAMLLLQVSGSDQRERVVISFSVRVVGMLLVCAAIVRSAGLGVSLNFNQILPDVSGYLLLAAGLRLGVLPPHQPFLREPLLRRGIGTLTRLIPVTASLILVTRVAEVGPPFKWEIPVLVVAVFAVLSGTLNWIRSQNELDGRPNWILAGAGFAVIAAVRQQPDASLAWGLGTIFSGSVLFLLAHKTRPVKSIILVGAVFFTALPYSPLWPGLGIYTGTNVFLGALLFCLHALLLLGYLRHGWLASTGDDESDRWTGVIAPFSLLILSITHFGLSWVIGGLQSLPMGKIFLPWWGGALVVAVASLVYGFTRRWYDLSENQAANMRAFLSLDWFYRTLWWLYRSISKTIYNLSQILEGEGGILWAILFLILFVTTLAQVNGGG